MEKAARRTKAKVSEFSGLSDTEDVPRTPGSRGPSRERTFCRQIGFLLLFGVCTLLSYYVAVVRLQLHTKDTDDSRTTSFPNSKHLSNSNEAGHLNPDLTTAQNSLFKLPPFDWTAQGLRKLMPWGRGKDEGSQQHSGKSAEVILDESDLARAVNKIQGQKNESQDTQLRTDVKASEIREVLVSAENSTQKFEQAFQRDNSTQAGGELSGSALRSRKNESGEGGLSSESSGKNGSESIPPTAMLRGDRKEKTTPVLRMVVAELQKQIEKSHLLSSALGLGEKSKQTGGGEESESESEVADGETPKPKKRKRRKFNSPDDLYDPISDDGYHQCVDRAADWPAPPAVEGRGYFYPGLDGGLSQQVFELTNSIAVARMLNVTWVVPKLGFDPYWQDGSNFSSVFDLDHFRKTLAGDVKVTTIEELPESMHNEYYWRVIDRIPYGREDQYITEFYDSFSTDKITKSYSFFTALDPYLRPDLEKLRCRAKYQALKFHPQIISTAQRLLSRMREKANGPFLALHLRFETDMVMYSASCDYGVTYPEELEYWNQQRKERGWPDPQPDEQMRREGRCPATPGEVGRWLQALGFNESTQVYLASGTIYHEDVFMPAFLEMFPNTFRKEDLFTEEEANFLKKKNNILAGIDFEVLVNADVTALTFHGMMKSSISGHRNWLGYKKTLTYPLWVDIRHLPWREFKSVVKHQTHYGQPRHRDGMEVMGNPVPECMCQGR